MIENIKAIITQYIDPYLDCDLFSAQAVTEISVEGTIAKLSLNLGFPTIVYQQHLTSALTPKLMQLPGITSVEWQFTTKIKAHAIKAGLKRVPAIKNIIAVASGKGGVGKSTVAVNLALALHAQGAKVALLDADIYGPSQPLMLGVRQLAQSSDGKHVLPVIAHGIQTMSLGYLLDNKETPMIWRGPMVSGALQQLFNDTLWQDIDYMIIDLPPGTGDIQLTLVQKIPLTTAIVVTTPQEVALLDVNKALGMFDKVAIPVLGIVENMAQYICKNCGHQEHIFSKDGGEHLAQRYQVPLLASLPLDAAICQYSELGTPIVIAQPQGNIATLYHEIALQVAARLSRSKVDYSDRFPTVVVEN